MASDGLVEWLSVCEAAEMERLSPSVLVQISAQIVVAISYQRLLFRSSLLFDLLLRQRRVFGSSRLSNLSQRSSKLN